MNSTPFNWSNLIAQVGDETFGIPTDVTFQIVEDDQIREVKAHKIILGMVSPMFKKMFFTTDVGDKTAKEIDIKETTYAAFQILIDAIYNTESLEDSLDGKSVHEVFDVINLIERYQIVELQKIVEKHITNYPVTEDTVLDVASEAMEYTNLFQIEAQHILLTCSKFLKPKLSDSNSILRYISENLNQKEVVSILLAKIYGMICPNCNYDKENCQNGKAVEGDYFRKGLVVTNNKDPCTIWSKCDNGTAKITKVADTMVNVEAIKSGVTKNGLRGYRFDNNAYEKNDNGIPKFIFYCN